MNTPARGRLHPLARPLPPPPGSLPGLAPLHHSGLLCGPAPGPGWAPSPASPRTPSRPGTLHTSPLLFIFLASVVWCLPRPHRAKHATNTNSRSYDDYHRLRVASHRCPPTPEVRGTPSLEVLGEIQTVSQTASSSPVTLRESRHQSPAGGGLV